MNTQVSAGKVARLGLIYALGSFAPQFINLALTPVFTRYLNESQMGIIHLATRIVGPITLIAQLGFLSVLKGRYFQVDPLARGTLVRTVFIGQGLVSLAICAALSLAGWLSVQWFPITGASSHQTIMAEVFLPGLPFTEWHLVYVVWLLIVWQAFFDGLSNLGCGVAQMDEQARLAVSLNWTRYLTHTVLGLIVVVGLGGLGLERQVTIFIGCAVAGIAAAISLIPRARGPFDRGVLRDSLVKGMGFVPHSIAAMLPQAVTVWLLGKHFSSAANGIFGAAMILPAMTETVLYTINNAIYPTLARLMHEGSAESRRRQARVYTYLILGVAALLVAITVAAPIVLRILLAPSFWDAIQFVPILALGWLFFGLYLYVGQPVYFVGGGWWLSAASTVAAVTHFIVATSVVERHGIHGACWSLAAGHAALFLMAAWAGNRLYPLPWEYGKIAAILLTAAGLCAADYWICQGLSWYAMIPIKIVLLAAWLPVLRHSGVISANDLHRVVHFVRQRVRRVKSLDS